MLSCFRHFTNHKYGLHHLRRCQIPGRSVEGGHHTALGAVPAEMDGSRVHMTIRAIFTASVTHLHSPSLPLALHTALQRSRAHLLCHAPPADAACSVATGSRSSRRSPLSEMNEANGDMPFSRLCRAAAKTFDRQARPANLMSDLIGHWGNSPVEII